MERKQDSDVCTSLLAVVFQPSDPTQVTTDVLLRVLTGEKEDDECDDRPPLLNLVSLKTDVGEIHRKDGLPSAMSQVPRVRDDAWRPH